MQLIKLNATDSTNLYLKGLMQGNNLGDFTVVTAENQTKGRGQMGTHWLSDPGKNLTFSVLKLFSGVRVEDRFRINIGVSLAIYEALQSINVPDLKIKWPNDIMSGNFKIGGILIENVLTGQSISSSIIGVGLNVNQVDFQNLPNVSSLRIIMEIDLDLDILLVAIVDQLKVFMDHIKDDRSDRLYKRYEDTLFRKGKPSAFKNMEGQLFMGIIKGITHSGKLVLVLENDILKEFDLKEIKLMY